MALAAALGLGCGSRSQPRSRLHPAGAGGGTGGDLGAGGTSVDPGNLKSFADPEQDAGLDAGEAHSQPDASGGSGGSGSALGGSGSALGGSGSALGGSGGVPQDGGGTGSPEAGAQGPTTPEAPDASPEPSPAFCGNGVQEPGEACDDGNLALNDACDEECRARELFYLVPNRTTGKTELYDGFGEYVRDFLVDAGDFPTNVVQLSDGSLLLGERLGARITRWTSRGEFLGVWQSSLQVNALKERGGELLVATTAGLRAYDLATGARQPDLILDTDFRDLSVLSDGALLLSLGGVNPAELQLRTASGGLLEVLADGNVQDGGQIAYQPDGRVLWALGGDARVLELLPESATSGGSALDGGILDGGTPNGGDTPDGGDVVQVGEVRFAVPARVGRVLLTEGKAIGVAELPDGSWFVTTSTSRGGVYDPDTGEVLRRVPNAEHRRFIEPFFARPECVLGNEPDAGADCR